MFKWFWTIFSLVASNCVGIESVLIKGGVSQNSVKLVNYKMPVKSKKNIKITA